MVKWVYFVILLGFVAVISCEALFPPSYDVDGDDDGGSCDNTPKCSGSNEVYTCKDSNPQTCETIDEECKPTKKSKHCKKECRCKEGFYRNKIGECISKKNCLKCNGPHEYFSCGSACDNVCDTLQKQNQTHCPIKNKVCNKKCYCESGYARDKNNICVPIDECPPPPCGKNEVNSQCANGGCRRWKCSDDGVICKDLKEGLCQEGCVCKKSYTRDEDGKCIPEDKCPAKCSGANEVYTCKDSNPQTCETIDQECKPIRKSKHCKKECKCKEGFYRNKVGECISKENCLKCNGPHEYFSCGSACDNECDTILTQNRTHCPIKNIVCNKKCYCEDGYARNNHNICVPIDECPLQPSCGENEELSDCANGGCRRWECSDDGVICNDILEESCQKGCVCKSSYTRDEDGKCIPEDECPVQPSCGENEELSDCANGGCRRWECSDDGVICKDLLEDSCQEGCVCKSFYTRNEDGKCIPEDKCPGKPGICGLNEEYSTCANGGCRRVSCALNAILCIDLIEGGCKEGCVCKDGYTKDNNNTCIPEDQCPPNCGLNEVYDMCPPLCPPKRCDVDESLIDCAPNPSPGDLNCQPGCRCADGYYRNENDLCVAKEECPPIIECGPNEIASRCVNGGCWKESCANPQTVCARPAPDSCKEGCRCKENYVRSDNGTCIPESECPPVCGDNEIYDECPPTCPPQRCDVDNRIIKCKRPPSPGDPDCKPGCRCKDDFYRNKLGYCVTRDECPPLIKCGENEYPSKCANGGCRKVSCAIPQIRCVKLAPGNCQEGCLCKENYLRADNGTCIPESECPPVCGDNEIYDECPPTCPPQRCDIDNRLIKCKRTPSPGSPDCKPGCRCKDDFYRNKLGSCVTRDECPPLIKCGENEYPSKCANGGCRKVSCAIPQIRCVKLAPGSCQEGCLCKKDYLRADNGTCIPEKDCPPVCGINEVYDVCPPICPPQRCDINIAAVLCLRNPELGDPKCKPGCRCADDHAKNKDGVCVPRNECPPLNECGPNEEYSDCANGGCRRFSCNSTGIDCVDIEEGGCESGCICKKNYTRSNDGTCIPESQCPKLCGSNEEERCDSTCNKQCNIEDGKCVPPTKSKICKLECYCKEGYRRNKDGECIAASDCSKEKTIDGLTEFEQGNIHFSEQFLVLAVKKNPNSSIVGSPFSILFLLAQLALYATGNSKKELLNLLNLSNDCEIRSYVPKYLKLISETNNTNFDLAQKIYGSAKYPFSENFKKDTKEVFNAQAQNVDFSKPQQAADIINKWVAKQTHNLIPNLISPDALSSLTRLVLVNAIYFKGDWKYQFKARNTKSLPFYTGKTESDCVDVKMMNQVGHFKYTEIQSLNVQVLQLPYKTPDISFIICLPKSRTGIKDLIKNLKQSSLIKRSFTELRSTRVDVSMPKLDISTTTDLKPLLSDAGVKAIFEPSNSGLRGILENPEDIYVTSGIQKAKLLLNETGTEAAAATAVVVGVRSLPISQPEPVIFNADHSFVYLITLKKLPIFIGIYQGPS